MRKLKRMVLRNRAKKMSDYGKNGKSIAIFRMLWSDYKEARENARAEKTERELLAEIKKTRDARKAKKL